MRRLSAACLVGAGLLVATSAFAQAPQAAPKTAPAPAEKPVVDPNQRIATTTTAGDTGLWFVPTAEIMPKTTWSFSGYRIGLNEGQGFSNISNGAFTLAWAPISTMEIFGSWNAVTRIDRDVRPLFFTSTAASASSGTGGGINPNFPFDTVSFTGNQRGDLLVGMKAGIIRQSDSRPFGFAFREAIKIPTGNKTAGTSTGRIDTIYDAVFSKFISHQFELSAYAGYLLRGKLVGYTLTSSYRYGVGAGFPSKGLLHVTAELYGEHYRHSVITAPAGLLGADGSAIPTSTTLKDPVNVALGLTLQGHNGFFVGAGADWNVSMKGRSAAGILGCASCSFSDLPRDGYDVQFRIGYHPVAKLAPLPPVTPPLPPPPPPPAPPRPNRPPTVRASCDPCTVEVGKTSTVAADAQDPDGDALTYQWRTPSGSLTSPTARQTPWTAPMQDGPVAITVTVNDGKGGTASDTTTIQVIKPPKKEYVFEDVHFDFDRFTLRADALRVLDEAIAAMQADATLKLEIEGHTCNIGTTEYNLALGERRAKAVLDYLTSRGIGADRLRTVSYGEERPKFDNSREETRRLNRRAALIVKLTGGTN